MGGWWHSVVRGVCGMISQPLFFCLVRSRRGLSAAWCACVELADKHRRCRARDTFPPFQIFEDVSRHRADKFANSSLTRAWDPRAGEFRHIPWREVNCPVFRVER